MASSQEQSTTVLDELMKELDNIVIQEDANKELQAVVHGIIGNCTSQHLELKYIHQYCGNFETTGPKQVLERGETTKFVHDGTVPKGSKVGVAYAANGHQWIMAWSVPLQRTLLGQPNVNKLYVEDGPVAPIDWNVIEKKLDLAGHVCDTPGARGAINDGSMPKLGVALLPRDPLN